jgi:DNA-binding beta-propeller fold protein YncE
LVLTLFTTLTACVGGSPAGHAQQTGGNYRVVSNWPAAKGGNAPKYGRADASGIAVSPSGQVYVFQRAPFPVLVFDQNGVFVRAWGKNLFKTPHGCRFDPEGNLWLTDLDLQQVFKYTPDGKLLQAWGTRGKRGNDATHFNEPTDVAFGPTGDIYISDGYNNTRVIHLSHDGAFLGQWGAPGRAPGQFNTPHSIAVDANGRVYVADRGNLRIQVFQPDGAFVAQWPNLGYVSGIWITQEQQLLAVEGYPGTLRRYDLDGHLLGEWSGNGKAPGQLLGPHMLTTDPQGNVYIAEINNRRVQKFAPVP